MELVKKVGNTSVVVSFQSRFLNLNNIFYNEFCAFFAMNLWSRSPPMNENEGEGQEGQAAEKKGWFKNLRWLELEV
jgi:hypothetical protein